MISVSNILLVTTAMTILLSRPQFFAQAFTRTLSTAFLSNSHTYYPSTSFVSDISVPSQRLINTSSSQSSSRLQFSSSEFELSPPAKNLQGDVIKPKKGQRIVSFGDVHGDLIALSKFLKTARVMDDDFNWCGGESLLVQVGDVLDRGDHELACFYLLCKLSRQASEAGGGVILLHGNHEALNAMGLFQYAFPEGNAEFEEIVGKGVDSYFENQRWRIQFAGNQPCRWAAFEPGGLLAEPLLSQMKVAVTVGHSVFVHAGLTATHIRDMGGIEGMNKAARDWILTVHHGNNRNDGDFSSVEEILNYADERAKLATAAMPACLGGGIGSPSPVWMRDYSQPSDAAPKNPKAQLMINAALESLQGDVQRMVMGHTPQDKINAALNGKAWRIDVGASRGVASGLPEVLEIIHEGGEKGEDLINILTLSGERVPSEERQILDVKLI